MTKKPILMVIYKYFHEDPRPQREAAALTRQGYKVDVICPKPSPGPYIERENMRFFCPVMSRRRGSKLRYILEYGFFLTYALFMSSWLHLRNRYSVVQVFVMPEILMLGCLVPKLFGARILMDWEDPSREVYLAKFDENKGGVFLALIDFFERISVRIADRIIVPNIGFTKAFVKRGIPDDKIDVVMNGTDNVLFSSVDETIDRLDSESHFVIFYNGSIIRRHGLDLLITAMKKVVSATGPTAVLRIIGHGEADFIDECEVLIAELGLGKQVEFLEHVNIKEMPGLIARASVGVIPNLENAFTRINFPQRIFEFAALRKPLVLAKMDGIEDYLSEQDVLFFEPGNADALADCLIELIQSDEHYQTVAENLQKTCAALTWEEPYLDIMNQMISQA